MWKKISGQYADRVFLPYLKKQLQDTSRLDVVWDTYIPDSLKESTREKRGDGVRRKVSGHTKLPRNWMDFLRDSMNKKELFAFLSSKVVEFNWPPDKAVYVTSGKAVSSIGSTIPMQNCNHEEADTRIVVHIVHALEQGAKTFHVRTVDTDVVVILVGTFYDLIVTQPLIDIWVAFGMGKNYRFYHINAICASLGSNNHEHYLCFTHFRGVIQHLPSEVRGKSRFGRHGRHIKTLLIHLCIWPVIHSSAWMSTLIHSRDSKDLLSFSMTELVICPRSTRPEENSSVRRIEQWTNFHPPGMRYFSISDG